MSANRKGYSHHRVRPVQPPVRRPVQWETYWLWTLGMLAVAASVAYVAGVL